MLIAVNLVKSKWFLFFILSFFIIVAYNSSGFNNFDEHYQIIEFANHKLGKSTLGDLAWEFKARIRSGIQPLLCYIVFKLAALVNITDVYDLAFILRAISAIFSVFVIRRFVISGKNIIEDKNYDFFTILSFTLWFIPYICVRFSSENWSGLFILAALTIIQSNKYQNNVKKTMILGALIGISILFRYQSALLAGGIILWLLFIEQFTIRKMAIVFASIIFILMIGIFIDRWLYGVYSFTLYNYFYVNIVQGVASNYGVSPWFVIILHIIKWPGPILGIIICYSIIVLLKAKPKSIYLWAAIPFLVVHSIIPHKELRFLYPVATLVPLVLVLAWQEISHFRILSFKTTRYVALTVLASVNTAGLIAIVSKGAGLAKVSVCEYINRHYPLQKVNVIYVDNASPYMDWTPPPKNTFYTSEKVKVTKAVTIWQKDFLTKTKKDYINLLVVSDTNLNHAQSAALLKKLNFEEVFQSIPEIVKQINIYYDPSINKAGLTLYQYKNR